MNRETYARGTLLVSIVLAGVYLVNTLYSRAISGESFDVISGFTGLGNVQQVILLLVMSVFFAATIMLRAEE